MNHNKGKVVLQSTIEMPEVELPIPGGAGGVFIRVFNLDSESGMTFTVNRLAPGAHIPAHFHREGAEAHYVLSGDFIEAGQVLSAGAFLTQAKGVVHGPHTTVMGCTLLTAQEHAVDPRPGADPDFHLA